MWLLYLLILLYKALRHLRPVPVPLPVYHVEDRHVIALLPAASDDQVFVRIMWLRCPSFGLYRR